MITQEEITKIVAANLVSLRKDRGLTQGELATKLNYSDKSVSKWERAESLPDLSTMQQLCDFYGITLDFLTHKPTADNIALYKKDNAHQNIINRRIICALEIVAIWTVAIIILGTVIIMGFDKYWNPYMSFAWAVPLSFLVLALYNKKWQHREWFIAYSLTFFWSFLLCFYIEIGLDVPDSKGWNLGFLFLLGIPLTVMVILYSRIKK